MKAVHLPAHRAFLRYLEIPGTDPPLLWLHGWQCTSKGELLEAASLRFQGIAQLIDLAWAGGW